MAPACWSLVLLPALTMSLIARADGSNLRILPVGDSITVGVGSSDGNGYRLDLRNMLISAGRFNCKQLRSGQGCLQGLAHTVDFIGSNQNGDNNADNQ